MSLGLSESFQTFPKRKAWTKIIGIYSEQKLYGRYKITIRYFTPVSCILSHIKSTWTDYLLTAPVQNHVTATISCISTAFSLSLCVARSFDAVNTLHSHPHTQTFSLINKHDIKKIKLFAMTKHLNVQRYFFLYI